MVVPSAGVTPLPFTPQQLGSPTEPVEASHLFSRYPVSIADVLGAVLGFVESGGE